MVFVDMPHKHLHYTVVLWYMAVLLTLSVNHLQVLLAAYSCQRLDLELC